MILRPVLGIDLGTTYSCVAHLDDTGRAVVVPNSESESTSPSVVYYEEGGDAVVGRHAKSELRRRPDRVVQHIKRRMGEPGFSIELDGRQFYPQQVSAAILEYVVTEALTTLGHDGSGGAPLADVVITVPAYFGTAEREATREAGELARLNVISVINEPTAAAIAYGVLGAGERRRVLVYDLGGGTFDVTVMETSPDSIRAIATNGSRDLGGAMWDAALRDLLLDAYREQHPDAADPSTDEAALGELDIVVEETKKALTRRSRQDASFVAHDRRVRVEISRETFEEHTVDLVEQTLHYVDLVLADARAKGVDTLDEIVLVGGMSRAPMIARALTSRLTGKVPTVPEPRLVDPDQIVAKGAALFAASKVAENYAPDDPSRPIAPALRPGSSGPLQLVDVTSRGYGVRAHRSLDDETGYVAWIIKPQSELPASHSEQFRTLERGQTAVKIVVYESATNVLSEDPDANTELITGELTGLPPGKPPGQPLEVVHTLGTDGVLRIVATGPSGQRLDLEHHLRGELPPEERDRPLPALAKH
ncbi:Hsp70 family protein [Pseudonocardia lacus]|uniref:Hsp70 family protein n=1 Tax=Pseudonocardia lacus TaxID=2835865 RepID=UPI001BDD6CBD|nr:Hsp70 family protein [Pseudonocardia lacus]